MKICHLILYSKNKKSLNKAFSTLLEYINSQINKKYFFRKTKKHFVSILKSPHVNKKAQEQFDFKIYSIQFSLRSYSKNFKYLYVFKKIRNNYFSDVKFSIKFSTNKKHKEFKLFNLDNFKLNLNNKKCINQNKNLKELKNLKNFQNPTNTKIKQFLKILDLSGEL